MSTVADAIRFELSYVIHSFRITLERHKENRDQCPPTSPFRDEYGRSHELRGILDGVGLKDSCLDHPGTSGDQLWLETLKKAGVDLDNLLQQELESFIESISRIEREQ